MSMPRYAGARYAVCRARRGRHALLTTMAAPALLLCAAMCAHADRTADIDKMLAAPDLQYALVGIHVIDVGTGQVLYSRNADVRMLPASNQKVLTSAAAYELLGPDHTYQTRVLADTKPNREGTLLGSVYLKGGGDPSLKHKQIEALAHAVRSSGIRHIEGNVIADATAFADSQLGAAWSWDYLDEAYAAQISALTVDGGCAKVTITGAAQPGRSPVLATQPPCDYLQLDPTAVTGGACKTPDLKRVLGQNLVALDSPIGPNDQASATIPVSDPARYCAVLFRQALQAAGVAVAGTVESGKAPRGARQLTHVTSLPLRKLLSHMNKYSDNNYAELILRGISFDKEGVGTRSASVAAVDAWAEGFGADPLSYLMYDGSGLSRLNCMTPRFLVQLLRHMRPHEAWVKTLPVMGQDGTLRTRLKGTPAQGKICAKTGYLTGVRALSGYATAASGRELVFSVLVNNTLGSGPARELQDRMCLLLVAQ